MTKILTRFSIENPRLIISIAVLATIICLFQIPKIIVDTDPENMLPESDPVRQYYNKVKDDFGIRDMMVLGLTDEKGVFRTEFLEKLERITENILKIDGIVVEDVISFSTTDNIVSKDGVMKVDRIMENVPQSTEDIERLKIAIYDNPLFVEKLVSKDGKSVALYLPIQQKNISHRISQEIESIVQKELGEGQKYYIAGLPVAEDTFGVEMFMQMGILAPLAGLMIFILMFILFRKVSLILSPMIIAMLSVVYAMGALIGLGFTVHIMSSMIPIFLMPIAVLDSIHLLSEFFDKYPEIKDRKKTILAVMEGLSTPMLYTSITTAVGFGSLVFAPIPPVQVFGAFIAFGVMVAWLLTVTFIPAFIMIGVNEEKLLTSKIMTSNGNGKPSMLANLLHNLGKFAFAKSSKVILGSVLILIIAVWGITYIRINDNPVRWFNHDHTIRVADRFMNKHFGGTYNAYLTISGQQPGDIKRPEVMSYMDNLQDYLEGHEIVGKTTSIVNIVKRVGLVLSTEENPNEFVPENQDEIGQYLFMFQMTGDPNDLDNFVDYEYQNGNIWIQMKGGDNLDMEKVEQLVAQYMEKNPAPEGLTFNWSGLVSINKTWQEKMVGGMAKALISSIVVVFILMTVLFRSPGLALISLLPLLCSIGVCYGIIGLVGKDLDMVIAICAALGLGLALDFAIHFIWRLSIAFKSSGNIETAINDVFQEPARAIARNAFVITCGFIPLVFATLYPYVTVGVFFAALMPFTAVTTLILLPALMQKVGHRLIKVKVKS